MVFGFATLMVAARRVSPDEIGTFLLMQTLAIFLMEISSFGLHLALPKFVSEEEDDSTRRSLIGTALSFRLGTIAVAALISYLSADFLANLFNFSVPTSLLIFIPVFVVLESLVRFTTVVMQGRHLFAEVGLSSAMSATVNAIVTVGLLLVFDLGALSLFYGKVLSRLVAVGYGVVAARIPAPGVPNLIQLRSLLSFGAPLQANYLLSFTYQRIDTLLIALFLGPTQVAFYEIARRIPDSLIDLHEAFVQVYFPYVSRLFSQGRREDFTGLLNLSNRWSAFLASIGALIAFLFGDSIMSLIFSDQYATAGIVFGWLMVAVVVVILDSNLGYTLIAVGEPGKPVVINLARTAVSIVLYLLLMPSLAATGAAITNSAAVALVLPIAIHFLVRRSVALEIRPIVSMLVALLGALAVWQLFGLDAAWQKLALIFLFLAISLRMSIVRLAELRPLYTELLARVRAPGPA